MAHRSNYFLCLRSDTSNSALFFSSSLLFHLSPFYILLSFLSSHIYSICAVFYPFLFPLSFPSASSIHAHAFQAQVAQLALVPSAVEKAALHLDIALCLHWARSSVCINEHSSIETCKIKAIRIWPIMAAMAWNFEWSNGQSTLLTIFFSRHGKGITVRQRESTTAQSGFFMEVMRVCVNCTLLFLFCSSSHHIQKTVMNS